MEKVKIGRVVEIEGLNIIVEINEKEISEKINFKVGNQITPVLINKLISIALLNGKELIGKIEKIVENNRFYTEENFRKQDNKICIFASLIGIYDYYTKKFDEGINNFPFINSEVYAISSEIKKNIMSISSEYKLKIGKSFNDNDVEIFANPDILFGKHLGIFGNTGTGKSCTVASIIQGLKDRLTDEERNLVKTSPKIIIFDSNNEYSNAFENTELKFLKIKKEELKLPHNKLSDSEYCKIFGASQGSQAPILKGAIHNLKNSNNNYSISNIEEEIEKIIVANSKGNVFNLNNVRNWISTMMYRIGRLQENLIINSIIDYNNIDESNNYIKNREQLKRVLEYTYDKILTNEKNTEPILLNCILSKLRDLFNLYYIILSKLSYRQAKLELNKWNLFVKDTKYYRFFNNKNTITLYNLFPFFIFWNAIFFYRMIKKAIHRNAKN